ncbi:MAG: ribonuclease HI family protein [Candidatus Tectomicrobia bacterium]|uniref:Ribonuclease HI family protein n=1 Tax=Tectimicrobiota bacterium TaxID=2528274 RepID=A0A933GM71_UNCTE|nr:ribonuclease HI family protein [Candidatus Tectomicrobia bacterium]
MKAIVRSDGSCKGNPGPAAIGAVVRSGNNISQISRYIGPATNNIAEYKALIYGLEEALRLKASSVEVWLDSELVLNQLLGKYRVKDVQLIPLHKKAKDLLRSFSEFLLKKASREENEQSHNLAFKAFRAANASKNIR